LTIPVGLRWGCAFLLKGAMHRGYRLAHILVVDDHEMVRQVVGLILERAGHRVSEARDGEHAMEVLQSVTPDMVLTDIDMSVMDGKRFLAELRSQFPGMPCAGMSWDNEGIEFDEFIHKPFDIKELIKMVGRVLERCPRRNKKNEGTQKLGLTRDGACCIF